MPIYEYRCADCEQIFEEWQKDFEQRNCNCPMCGGHSQRLISNSAFVLKGSGWYTTDYCNRGASTTGSSGGNAQGAEPKAAASGGDSAGSSAQAGSGGASPSSSS